MIWFAIYMPVVMWCFRRVCNVPEIDYYLRHVCLSVCPSVHHFARMGRLGCQWKDFHEILYWCTFRKTVDVIQVLLTSDKNDGYFIWKPMYIYDNISLSSYIAKFIYRWSHLGMRNFLHKIIEKLKILILFSVTFFFRKSCLFKNNVKKNVVEPGRPQISIWRVCIECWIPKSAKKKHSEYARSSVFPLQHWLHECSSVSRYTYIVSLQCINLYPIAVFHL